MTFPPQFLDDIRDRLILSDIVGRHVALKRKGHEWTACCPFHQEKTPSFYVNDEKAFYYCFGCGKHGDHFGFLMEIEGFGFLEAVKSLADAAGLIMPEMQPGEIERIKARKSLSEIMELVTRFYEMSLRAPEGKAARAYLDQRGIQAQTVKKYRLGFAPQGALVDAMAQRHVTKDALQQLGLIRVYEDQPTKFYEMFRDRLMFPITDRQGNVVAFGGRILGEGTPKYLNSPETDLFSKGRLLYGLAQGRRAALDARELVVTEGYMDVIALSQAGLPQSVAPLGTAVTEDQLRLLWKLVPSPTFALDGDAAGRSAAHRAVERALPLLKPGLSLKFAWLPDSEDPDSLLNARGLSAFTTYLNEAMPLSEVLWEYHFDPLPQTPEARSGAWQSLVKDIERLSDKTVQATFAADYEARFESTFGVRQIAQTWQSSQQRRFFSQNKKLKSYERAGLDRSPHLTARGVRQSNEEIFITLLIDRPELVLTLVGDTSSIHFSNKTCNDLFQAIFVSAVRLSALDKTTLLTHVRDVGLGAALAQFDTHSMRTKAGLVGTKLSEQEFSTRVLDVWGKLTQTAARVRLKLP